MTCGRRGEIRQFPAAQKLKAIMRAEEGEGVVPMVRKPGVRASFCMTGSRRGKPMGLRE
jgi:hypothetical protein